MSTVKPLNILISGAGIAGPTLAYWLQRYGWTSTLIERAPRLRTGGYIIDFWGTGFDVAEQMALLPTLRAVGYDVKALQLVDTRGRQSARLSADFFRVATEGRYVSLPRGQLASAVYGTIDGSVETRFDESITAIRQDDDGVDVAFERAPAQRFDVVVGADGLHSVVRRLTFGERQSFEKYLGYIAAAFEVEGYRHRDERTYVSYTLPGKQVARFAMRDDRTMFFFIFATDHPAVTDFGDMPSLKSMLHRVYDDAGWECAEIMAAMDGCDQIYADHVSQIHMPAWTSGRIALVGDAAFCPSLLAGEGSALAMAAAYVLAGELYVAGGNYREAFARYEQRLRPFITSKQATAHKFARALVPRTPFGLSLRNRIAGCLGAFPALANRLLAGAFVDDYSLPRYGEAMPDAQVNDA
jgi:2-polyprenyl-6-methoxyphenol hydroxylase-like FAD-dependent oxidoreductase